MVSWFGDVLLRFSSRHPVAYFLSGFLVLWIGCGLALHFRYYVGPPDPRPEPWAAAFGYAFVVATVMWPLFFWMSRRGGW